LLKEAIQAVGQGRWQDVPPDLGSSSFAWSSGRVNWLPNM
jgi:hypothetical protein